MAEIAEMSLEELLEITAKRIKNRKPNTTIIAQLTRGKERQKPVHQIQNHTSQPVEVDLISHISVDFIKGASIAIRIVQQTECPTTGSVVSCGSLEPLTLEFGYQSEVLQQAELETGEDAQMLALEFAVALARRTIRERWPREVMLGGVKFCIGSTLSVPGHHRTADKLAMEYGQNWDRDLQAANEESNGRMHSLLEHIQRLKVEMANRSEGITNPIHFEHEEKRNAAWYIARQKQKSLQASPRWKKRWQRDLRETKGQSRVKEIVREYRARMGY